MPVRFRWNDWNLDHATRHGCTIAEIERVVRNNQDRKIGDQKRRVQGRGIGGRFVQVVFIESPKGYIYVIHAMPLER